MLRRIPFFMVHAFILTGLLLSPASAYLWHGQSGTTPVTIDPSTPSTLYVGTSGGGVFMSTDAGATWGATGLTQSTTALVIATACGGVPESYGRAGALPYQASLRSIEET